MISLLNSTNTNPDNQRDESEVPECCICYEETGPFQALFLAPCSHCYHYKCVANIIVQSAMFQCPLCRQVANLTASVSNENLHAAAADDGEIAIGAKGDPKKFLQAAQAIETAKAAAEAAAAVAAVKQQKKRTSSFTARISTIFRRSSSISPNSASPASPGGVVAISIPNSSSPLRNAAAIDEDAPVIVVEEPEQVPDVANASLQAVLNASNNIPRSATANTFEDEDDSAAVAPQIPHTIQESTRELRIEN